LVKNVKLINSYVWDNVVIAENCTIYDSIICEDVTINQGTIIRQGCVIGAKVEVKANVEIPERTKASMSGKENGSAYLVKGKIYKDPESGLEECEEVGSKPTFIEKNLVHMDSSDEEEEEDKSDFKKDVADILAGGIESKNDVEILAAEINGVRLSYNESFADCISYALPIILGEIKKLEGKTQKDVVLNIQKVMTDWDKFIKYFVKEDKDQRAVINEIEKFSGNDEAFQSGFHIFLQILFKSGTLTAGPILKWAEESKLSTNPIIQKFVKLMEPFVNYLAESDDEEEEEEEDAETDENKSEDNDL